MATITKPIALDATLQRVAGALENIQLGKGAEKVIAAIYSNNATYAVGDYAIHDGKLYSCSTAIATPESWTEEHWTEILLSDEVKRALSNTGTIQDVRVDGVSVVNNGIANVDGISDIKSAISKSKTAIPATLIPSGYIKYVDGDMGSSTANGYTDYVDVSNYKRILFTRIKSTASNPGSGTAFYDSAKNYISGVQSIKGASDYGYFGELVLVTVPENAKYARFTTWVDVDTYGNFELYGINERFYENEAYSSLLTEFDQKNNIIDLGGFYYQKLCNYGYNDATRIKIEKYGNRFILNGTATADTRIKITNGVQVATTNSTVDNLPNPLKFKPGHKYNVSLNNNGSYDTLKRTVTISVYKPGEHSSVGVLRRRQDGNTRTFTATQENYNVCIYVNSGSVLSDYECTVEITDVTGEYIDLAETYRLYDCPDYGTAQSVAIMNRTLYVCESNSVGIVKVNLSTGEKTKTSITLGHANDMTIYNGKFYITGMEDNGRIYIVDPGTLEIESYVDFTINGEPAISFGIAYDRVNNRFILEVGDDFVFADASLNYVSSVPRAYISGATRQGFECDGYYLYCPEYSPNNIVVYDYSGNLVKEIAVSNSNEPEALFNDWTGGWWLVTNIPSHEWYVDAINFRNKIGIDMVCAFAKVF